MTVRKSSLAFLLLTAAVLAWSPARGDDLRVRTMGNTRIALEDEDNRLNMYDYGRNPSYLLRDFESHWTRLDLGALGEAGNLRRPYDPHDIENYFGAASGIVRLGRDHVITGSIRLGRVNHGGVWRSLEIDQYNDPFYMTDLTTGDFRHDGPSMSADYALRLKPRLFVGAGFDYDISTGLKDTYTRPEIVHNNFMANLGITYEPTASWTTGIIVRPQRIQNRTQFEKAQEEFDNVIFRYYGDAIYDMFATTAMTVREVTRGIEIGLQNFFAIDQLVIGTQLSYDGGESEIKYGSSTQELLGYWQDNGFDVGVAGRYRFGAVPLTVGVRGGYSTDEGWAKRPEYEDVLLYENQVDLWSGGVGAAYELRSLQTLVSVEYVANDYGIALADYGAGTSQDVGILQNIGRLGVEYSLFNLHSIRAGVEVTDYLVDRWLKLPGNTDRYSFTTGMKYRAGYWDVDVSLQYGMDTKSNTDADRQSFGAIVRFNHILE
jgi:hypothetical protein